METVENKYITVAYKLYLFSTVSINFLSLFN